MKLPPGGVDYYRPRPLTDPAIPASDWKASFDGGLTFTPATVLTDLLDEGEPAWLVANAATAVPGAAIVLPAAEWVIPGLGFDNDPAKIVRPGPPIYLT